MASGYVDWHKRTYADIIAQSIEKILIDIAAVSVDELPVNVKAQDLSKMNIDITAQTIQRLTMSYSLGTAHHLSAGGTISPGQTLTLFDISVAGVIYGGFLQLGASTDAHYITVYFESDGLTLHGQDIAAMNAAGLTDMNAGIMFLLKYDDTNKIYTVAFTRGFTWDSHLKIKIYLPGYASNNVNYQSRLYYALR